MKWSQWMLRISWDFSQIKKNIFRMYDLLICLENLTENEVIGNNTLLTLQLQCEAPLK